MLTIFFCYAKLSQKDGEQLLNLRIKEIRNEFQMTQQQFANKLGIKRSNVGKYETNVNIPSDAVISLICKEFNINEKWLRTGFGEKYLQANNLQDEYNLAVTQIDANDPRAKNLILEYWKLSPKDKELFMDFMERFVTKK